MVGGAAACAALAPLDSWARRVPEFPILQPWTLPSDLPGNPLDAARTLIAAGVLAPSDWNTQPWRFEVETPLIRVVADPKRALPVTDPDRRGTMLSLGAALENMLVAARSYGLQPGVRYMPHEGANGVVAELTWTPGEQRRDRALFAAIPERRTNRRDYDGRAIYAQNRALLSAQFAEGVNIHWMDDRDRMQEVADLVFEATRDQTRDVRAQAEQFQWLRFDGSEKKRGDGVAVESLGFSGPAEWFASRYFDPTSFFLRFGVDSAAKQARGQVRSAGALVLLTATRRDEVTRLMAGQALERFALQATSLGIAHHALSAPVETERVRSSLLAAFGARGEDPLLVVRLGHAKPQRAAVRRAVSQVATYRNT